MNTKIRVMAIVAVCAVPPACWAQEVASTDVNEICASDGRPGSAYSRLHRTHRWETRPGFEHDHVVPLCLGGADTEKNLQWQPWGEAREKDRLEAFACRSVCRGAVSLTEAQSWFFGDWRKALR